MHRFGAIHHFINDKYSHIHSYGLQDDSDTANFLINFSGVHTARNLVNAIKHSLT